MRPERTPAALRWIALLASVALSCGNVWAASGNCKYSDDSADTSGTGMGGTGDMAKGTGIGGTGIRLGVYLNETRFVGNVSISQGTVEAQSEGRSRFLAKGDPVCAGDTIITSQTSLVQIKMADGGSLTLRPQTQLKIEKFVYGGTSKDGSLIALHKGACRIVSGKTGHRYPLNVLLKTPTATIGAHGADHEATVILPGDSGGQTAGTYDKVNTGTSSIKTEMGEVDIQPNQVGFAASNDELPSLLEEIPGFYKDYPPLKQESNSAE